MQRSEDIAVTWSSFRGDSEVLGHVVCEVLQHFEQSPTIHVHVHVVVIVIVVVIIFVVIVVVIVVVDVDVLIDEHYTVDHEHEKAEEAEDGELPFLS